MAITIRKLEALQVGKSLTDDASRGEGALVATRKPGGTYFYFRYTKPDGSRDRLPLGAYDRDGDRGLTLVAAQKLASKHRTSYRDGERDLRAAIQHREREQAAARAVALHAEEAAKAKKDATLGVLCAAYVEQLERDGKSSRRDVERALHRHIRDRWPKFWGKPASDVEPEDILAVLEELTEAGKNREAGKLRAYIRAAYGAAVASHTNPLAVVSLRRLKLRANPMRDLGPIHGAGSRRERALSVEELRAYWARIVAMPAPSGPLLRFHLLTGGQRCEQLARVRIGDWDQDSQTVTLLDGKGRRSVPRRHVVPVIPAAAKALDEMAVPRVGDYLFTTNCGASGARYPAFAQRIRDVAAAMVKAKEAGAPFTPGDLRRTVETRLAALGVSTEIRAQVQSHGLGGVQARHYDRHDYADEKRDALERLYDLVTGSPATVTPIRRKRA